MQRQCGAGHSGDRHQCGVERIGATGPNAGTVTDAHGTVVPLVNS